MCHRYLLALFALLFSASTLIAQDDEVKLEAVQTFKRYFRTYKEVEQKVEAVQTLKGNECAPACAALVPLLDHKEEPVRRAVMEVLCTYHQPETFAAIVEQLPKMKQQDRRALFIEVLGRAGIQSVLPVLHEIALQDKRATAPVKWKIAEAMGLLKDKEGGSVLEVLLADKDPTVRIAAADAIGAIPLREAGKFLLPLLQDKAWQVKSAAIRAAGLARVESAIDPLIVLLQDKGRLQEEVADTLFLITTRDYGVDAEAWRKSVANLRKIGWTMPSDAKVEKAKETRRRNDALYGKKDAANTFAKISTTSTKVLFIVDVSGSMSDHVVEKEKFAANYADHSKMTIVKTELSNTIEGLDASTHFNIVAFASDLDPWRKGLVPANIVNRSSAKDWIAKLKPLGGASSDPVNSAGKTNTFKALMYPFNVKPEQAQTKVFAGAGKAAIKNKLDTVFFLSDGRPTVGKFVETDEILQEVRELNRSYRLVIHAIAIGQFPKNFLRTLALENGGAFVDLGY